MSNNVIYFGGGTMSGVFGGGIVTALQEANVYDKLKAVYGSSSGAVTMAYFLARQSELGSSIFWENLTSGFIYPKRILSGTIQRFHNKYISPISQDEMLNVVEIDYLLDVMKNEKKLNVDLVKEQKISAYVKVGNLRKRTFEWRNLKKDTLKTLKAAVSIVPYYYSDEEDIDGEAIEPLGLYPILAEHPNSKIVVALNWLPDQSLRHILKYSLEGMVSSFMCDEGFPLFKLYLSKSRKFARELSKVINSERVLLISPPEDNPTTLRTRDPKKLKKTYEMGKREAEKIIEFLE